MPKRWKIVTLADAGYNWAFVEEDDEGNEIKEYVRGERSLDTEGQARSAVNRLRNEKLRNAQGELEDPPKD